MGYVGTKFDDMRETFLQEGRQEGRQEGIREGKVIARKEILELLGKQDKHLMERVALIFQQEFPLEN